MHVPNSLSMKNAPTPGLAEHLSPLGVPPPTPAHLVVIQISIVMKRLLARGTPELRHWLMLCLREMNWMGRDCSLMKILRTMIVILRIKVQLEMTKRSY